MHRYRLGHFGRLALTALLGATLWLALLVPSTSAQGTSVSIQMGERGNVYFFEPTQISVPAGQVRLSFNNMGSRAHNFVITVAGQQQRTPDVPNGRTMEQTFNLTQPGTYQAICDLPTHAERGMRMMVTVTAPPGGAAPATGGQAQATAPTGAGGTGTGSTTSATSTTGSSTSTGTSGTAGTTGSTGSAGASVLGNTSPAGTPYLISLMIHIPAAIAWLGIVLYDAIVAAVPFLTPAQRGALLARPRWAVLLTIPLFGLTGIYQTIFNPFGTITSYEDLSHLRSTTTYGFALFLKHGFVFSSMALTLAVTFWFAPRLIAFANDVRPEAVEPSRMPSLLAWLNVAACVALLACVAVMVFQLH